MNHGKTSLLQPKVLSQMKKTGKKLLEFREKSHQLRRLLEQKEKDTAEEIRRWAEQQGLEESLKVTVKIGVREDGKKIFLPSYLHYNRALLSRELTTDELQEIKSQLTNTLDRWAQQQAKKLGGFILAGGNAPVHYSAIAQNADLDLSENAVCRAFGWIDHRHEAIDRIVEECNDIVSPAPYQLINRWTDPPRSHGFRFYREHNDGKIVKITQQ